MKLLHKISKNNKIKEKNIKCGEHPSRNLEMICLEEICKICNFWLS